MKNVLLLTMAALCALPAAAQNYSFTFTGTGSAGHTANGSGTGTVTPGGAAAISFTVQDSGNSNCDNRAILSMKVQFGNGDTLSLLYLSPDSNNKGDGAPFSFTGSLTVTGGTGAFANVGGTGNASTSVTINSDKSFSFSITGTLNIGGPLTNSALVNAGGVVPVFSDQGSIQAGSWVSIYGSALANATALWNGDFPPTLGGVTVTIDSKAGYLWFVSPGQINVQVPDDSKTGCVPVVVTTPNGTVSLNVDLEPASPSLSLLDNQYVAAVILTPNGKGAYGGGTYDLAGPVGKYSYPTRPVKRGETIELFGVGLGPTKQVVAAGKAFSGATPVQGSVNIALGSNNNVLGVPTIFAGLVGAGLYQINVTIPQNAPTGDVAVGLFEFAPGSQPGSQPSATTSQDLTVLLPIQ